MAAVRHTRQVDGLKKPAIWRQLLPWGIAICIVAYMIHIVQFEKMMDVLRGADASWIIAAFLIYSGYYYVTDILSFWRTYCWLNICIDVRETARLRFASYSLQAINGAIAEIVTLIYMFRVKKMKVLWATSSALFIYFNEMLTLIILLTYCAFFLPVENRISINIETVHLPLWTIFQGAVIAAWVVGVCWVVFWRTKIRDHFPKVRDNNLLRAFKLATLENYGEIFLYRFSNNLLSVFMNIVMLRALGINAPVQLLFAVVPIMVNVAYLPVSAAGFGGPQLVAYFLLKGYATEAAILAYSLVWSSLFFITRTLTGVPFIRTVYRIAFPEESTIANGDKKMQEEMAKDVNRNE